MICKENRMHLGVLYRHFILPLSGSIASLIAYNSTAAANSNVTVEAVDAYSACGSLSHNVEQVDAFRAWMVFSGSVFTNGLRWTNGDVWPTDFTDPQLVSGGDDSGNFDRDSDAVAYFSGHGSCNDQTTTVCNPGSVCPDDSGLASRCIRYSENPLKGRCMYARPRTLTTQRSGMTSCQSVNYSGNSVRWGESTTANWSSAGTNGNVNLAIIDNSCGVTPALWITQLTNAFAGISSIGLVMPTRQGSDTADVKGRGMHMGFEYYASYVGNTSAPVGTSWTNILDLVTGGSSCAFGGGNHGINGCGAHITLSAVSNHRKARALDHRARVIAA